MGTHAEAEVEALLAVVAVHGAPGLLRVGRSGDEGHKGHEGEHEGGGELHFGSNVVSVKVSREFAVAFGGSSSQRLFESPKSPQKSVKNYELSVPKIVIE
jgi:hypothetical protein